MQHIHGTPTSPALINPHIPPALTAVIMRSLARDPAARYSSATAMVTAVAKALNTSISNEDTLLAAQKVQLTNELNMANQILQSIPSQLNQVNEIYSAITGYNQNRTG